jgi:hypothetical protein
VPGTIFHREHEWNTIRDTTPPIFLTRTGIRSRSSIKASDGTSHRQGTVLTGPDTQAARRKIANPQDTPSLALVMGVHRSDKQLKFWLHKLCVQRRAAGYSHVPALLRTRHADQKVRSGKIHEAFDSEQFNSGQRRRSHWPGSLRWPRLRNRAMADPMQRCLQRYPPRPDSQSCRRHRC